VNPFESIRLRRQIEALRPRLYRLACGWCRDPHAADDLVQDTLERALMRLGALRDQERLEVWLVRIMHNRHLDLIRARRDFEPVEDEQLPGRSSPEDETAQEQLIRLTRTAVAQLPADHRHVLLLVDLEEFTYAEAAAALGVPIGTIMSRLSRARARLRALLGPPRATATDEKVVALENYR
jgi:RNA polymerase sigma-70 factor (ECF subfamily)